MGGDAVVLNLSLTTPTYVLQKVASLDVPSYEDELNRTLGIIVCPESSSGDILFPSTFGISLAIALLSLLASILVLRRYNFLVLHESDGLGVGSITEHVTVYTPLTSNTFWALYFIQVFLKHFIDTLMFGEHEIAKNRDALAFVNYTDQVMAALTCLSLSWALLYQLKHRSGQAFDGDTADMNSDSSGDIPRRVCRYALSAECGLVVLAIIHVILAWFAIPNLPGNGSQDDGELYWVFVSSCAMQQVPLLVIAFLLVVPTVSEFDVQDTKDFPLNPNSYPSYNARALLATGIILELPHMLPATTWTDHILLSATEAHRCPLYIFSWYDIILIMYAVSLGCFVAFLRLEFLRVREQELYSCHIEDVDRTNNRRVL
ncbi:hypothetical protein DIPPA_05669 [Diplonema papillatum]|nr:hypothetical protein DIPPA_05669 [Diplonema papillatum]